MGISENESDIRWRITLQRNLTSTIAALFHYEGPSSVKAQQRMKFDPKRETSLSEYMTPHRKI